MRFSNFLKSHLLALFLVGLFATTFFAPSVQAASPLAPAPNQSTLIAGLVGNEEYVTESQSRIDEDGCLVVEQRTFIEGTNRFGGTYERESSGWVVISRTCPSKPVEPSDGPVAGNR